jgi:hypothetical protein
MPGGGGNPVAQSLAIQMQERMHGGTTMKWVGDVSGHGLLAVRFGAPGATLRLARVLGLAVAFAGTAGVAQTDRVTIDPDVVLDVNGYSKIEPQMFGVTAYEGAPLFDPHRSKDEGARYAEKWGIESVGYPGILGWVLPPGDRKIDAAEMESWFATPGQGARSLFFDSDLTDRYIYGRILPTTRVAGAEPWIYILGGPAGCCDEAGVPVDRDAWVRAVLHYLDLCIEADPKLTYIHLFNEPNSSWFRTGHYGRDYASIFVQTAQAIKQKHPQIQVGGPVLCWPPTFPGGQEGQEDWYTWELYSKPLIDIARDTLDFLDWHVYDCPAEAIAGEVSVVTAYAQSHQGKWLRNALTETNFHLDAKAWEDRETHYRKRTFRMAQQLLTLLRHPDKVFCQQVHDLGAAGWRFTAEPPSSMQELFAILKPLRGQRIPADSNSDGVMVEAAAHGDFVAVAVLNRESKERTLALKGVRSRDVRSTSAMVLDAKGLRAAGIGKDGILALPGESIAVVTYAMKRPFSAKRQLAEREFFALDVMAKLPDTRTLVATMRVPAAAARSADRAVITFGTKGPGSSGKWEVKTGQEESAIIGPGAYCRLPLRRVPQDGEVEVSFTCRAPQDRSHPDILSFASISLLGKSQVPR